MADESPLIPRAILFGNPERASPETSPDGKFLAVAERTDANQFGIFLLSIETGEERRLATPPTEYIGDMHPAFSPDGRTLAFTRTRHVEVSEVYLMPVAGGEARQLTSDNQVARSPAWAAG